MGKTFKWKAALLNEAEWVKTLWTTPAGEIKWLNNSVISYQLQLCWLTKIVVPIGSDDQNTTCRTRQEQLYNTNESTRV